MVRYKLLYPILTVTTTSGLVVAIGYTRIVHGGRGDYLEFTSDQILRKELHIPIAQDWRVESHSAYYVEFRTKDDVKVYFQRRRVNYADYKIGLWYISPEFIQGFKPYLSDI